jgi:ABC-type nitrate/sulfonate/bicarbonate transport system substrate-binding protein
MPIVQTRRRFLESAALAGAAGLLSTAARADEPGPETTMIRVARSPAICTMPQMITRQLLLAEGFTDIHYVDVAPAAGTAPLGRGEVDLMVHYAPTFVVGLDSGQGTTVLAGVHVGCIVLFGNERVDAISGLKGKAVGVTGAGPYQLLSLMAAEVGLDPIARQASSLDPPDMSTNPRYDTPSSGGNCLRPETTAAITCSPENAAPSGAPGRFRCSRRYRWVGNRRRC